MRILTKKVNSILHFTGIEIRNALTYTEIVTGLSYGQMAGNEANWFLRFGPSVEKATKAAIKDMVRRN